MKKKRNSQSLRDALFDELEELRSGDGDPSRAMAVANLAKQIINIAKVELDFHREMVKASEAGVPLDLGNMPLGSDAKSADATATEQKGRTTNAQSAPLPS